MTACTHQIQNDMRLGRLVTIPKSAFDAMMFGRYQSLRAREAHLSNSANHRYPTARHELDIRKCRHQLCKPVHCLRECLQTLVVVMDSTNTLRSS